MRSFFYIIFASIISLSFFIDPYRSITNTSFKAGEYYEYRIKFGIFPVGEALVDVSPQIFSVNNRPCFRVNILGRTTGLTDLFNIRNNYRSYLDTSAFVSQRFLMNIKENNYKKEQTVFFNHINNTATRSQDKDHKDFKVPDNIQDVVSGYYFLRILDFSKIKMGETISANLFFDDEIYNMKVKYNGKGEVKTKFGKIKVLKLNPILPPNKMFEGENAIRVWVSDDKNHVPIRIEVDFSVGSASMELKQYRGNRHEFDWIK
jgi:hypothetical protein